MTQIRILLVDDQALVRAGLRMIIDSQPDLTVVAEAGDGAQAVSAVDRVRPDLVVMDLQMPVLDGVCATRRIMAAPAAPRVVLLTTFDLDSQALAGLHAGASGFLLKDTQPEVLVAALRAVHAGDAVIAPSTTRRLLEHLVVPAVDPSVRALLDQLTDREREVLVGMGRGWSNTELAERLHIAEGTVKTHVGRVLAKLGVRDRVQAVVLAHEAGLVPRGGG